MTSFGHKCHLLSFFTHSITKSWQNRLMYLSDFIRFSSSPKKRPQNCDYHKMTKRTIMVMAFSKNQLVGNQILTIKQYCFLFSPFLRKCDRKSVIISKVCFFFNGVRAPSQGTPILDGPSFPWLLGSTPSSGQRKSLILFQIHSQRQPNDLCWVDSCTLLER